MSLTTIDTAAAGLADAGNDAGNTAGVTGAGDPAPDAGDAGDDGEGHDGNGGEDDGEDTGDDDATDKSEDGKSGNIDRRIAKLTAARKDAESRAKSAEDELAALKGSAMSDADARRMAEEAGILPELVTAAEAKSISEWRKARANEKFLSEWLEDHDGEDELESGGKSYSRQEVRRMRREWRERLEELGDAPEKAQKRAAEEFRALLKLGREARKAGWKPGAATPKAPAKPAARKPEGATQPGEGHPSRPAKAARAVVDLSKVTSEDDFAAAIAAGQL